MSLGFNLGQTGNASQVGAGIVKLATQAQIDAGDADDGGVPLVATPDKLPRADAFLPIEAGEPILKGQPTIVGDGLDSSVLLQFNDGTGGAASTGLVAGTWIAQSFTVPVGFSITAIAVQNQMVQSRTITLRLRETVDGPDLAIGSQSYGATGGGTVFRNIGITPYQFVEGQTYFIVASGDSASLAIPGSTNDNYPNGSAFLSTDSGATFNPHPTISDFYIRITGVRTIPGLAYLATDNVREQFAGFAQADYAKGETASINTQNYLAGLYDADLGPLTIGQKYYFSGTPGELATSGSNLLGIAPTTTDLLRLV